MHGWLSRPGFLLRISSVSFERTRACSTSIDIANPWYSKACSFNSKYTILALNKGYVCFVESGFWKITLQTFLCLFVIRKVGQWKTLSSQRKIWLGFQENVFLKNLDGKHFPEVVKNLKMSYYLLIISNLILKLLIAIYILFWIFIFQFHLLKFNFYINFDPYFYNCYLLFPYYFFIEIFYLSNLILIL